MNNKCHCKSKPEYHREDCPEYDVFGNKKTNFKEFESPFHQIQSKSRLHRVKNSSNPVFIYVIGKN